MTASTGTLDDFRSLEFSWFRRLPVIRQTETAECGLACLAMIAAYHGHDTNLETLRRRIQAPAQGLNLKQLIELAAHLGFAARPLKVELTAVARLQRPCILHWDMNHFVVLKAARRRLTVVHDPAAGERKLDPGTFSRHFTGVALELTPTARFQRQAASPSLRLSDLWTRIAGLKRSLGQVLFLSLLLQLFAIAAPFFMQTVVDDVVLRGDTGLLGTLAMGFGLLLVIETGAQALRTSVILHLSCRLHLQLAANLFSHLLRLPLDYFRRRHLGDVLSRFSSLASVREILSTGLVTAIVDGLMALVMLAVMFLYDSRLALIVVAVLLVYTGIRFALFPTLRRLSAESIGRHALGESSLIETVRAIQTVKLYQGEDERRVLWQNRLTDAMNTDIRIARLRIGFEAANTLFFGLENILVIYFAAGAVMANAMSLGMVFAFMSYKRHFVGSVDRLIDQLIEIRMMGLHLRRISDIALTAPEEHTPQPMTGTPPTGRRASASIACSDLSFRYSSLEPWVFDHIDLEVEAGSAVAITGPSGAGKSSLLKCLMGLVPHTRGEVRVDGIPIARACGYRGMIAAVMQDDHLLSGSIAENIACFAHRTDLERLEQCARIACIHDDIMAMPMQYDTPVGDMGSSLSGGQIQRIMLARAAYRRPRILFLDEATSHLDIETEKVVNDHIAAMRVTRILVAHRPDTIALADTVIHLRPGGRASVSRNGS